MGKLSAVIITLNEEKKLGECLQSIKFVDEIIVVDSGSVDGTRHIAEQAKAKVYSRRLEDFSSQKNYGISQATGDWILLIDADERVTANLEKEIQAAVHKQTYVGFHLKRDNIMFGGHLRYGASFNDFQLRLIKKGAGQFVGLVHERIQANGPVGKLKTPLIHVTYQTLDEYFSKFNLFSSLDAQELLKQGASITWLNILLKPIFSFFYFYFLKLGFLDGKPGLIYQVLSSFYIFVRNVKAKQCRERGIS